MTSLRRFAFAALLLPGFLVTNSFAQDERPAAEVPPLRMPDDQANGATVLAAWLKDRGVEVERQGNTLQFRHNNILVNVLPSVFENDLDRLLVSAFYTAQDEFKGSQTLIGFAADRNASQNLARVFVDGDGDLGISSSMTFFDEFSPQEFDAFMNLFTTVVRENVLKKGGLKLLN